jgi:hypothetical protein
MKGDCSVIIRLLYWKQTENVKINHSVDRPVSWSRFEPVPFDMQGCQRRGTNEVRERDN